MNALRTLYASASSSSSSEDEDAGVLFRVGIPPRPSPPPTMTHDALMAPHGDNHALDKRRQEISRRFAANTAAAARQTHHRQNASACHPYEPRKRRRPLVMRSCPATSDTDDTAESRHSPLSPARAPELFADLDNAPVKAPPRSHSPAPRPCCLKGHTGTINTLRWNALFPQLLLSASMDHTVRVWAPPLTASPSSPGTSMQSRRVLRCHTQGVSCAVWTSDGRGIVTGGFDGLTTVVDAERLTVLQRFEVRASSSPSPSAPPCGITSVRCHPTDPALLLLGTGDGRILLQDIRLPSSSSSVPPSASPSNFTSSAVAVFTRKTMGDVHDLLFLPSTSPSDRCFVSSSGITARATSHQTLMVWDLRRHTLVSDRLDRDLFSFTCLRLHPSERWFVAQSMADRATPFAALTPFKRVKPVKRQQALHPPPLHFQGGHRVGGFRIQCSFSADDGVRLASGDANGRVVLYDSASRRQLGHRVVSTGGACLSTEFHPTHRRVLAAGSQHGQLQVFQDM